MKKNKIVRCGLLATIALLMVISPFPQAASATVVNSYTWRTMYESSPNIEWDPAETLGREMHVVSDGGHISFDLGLAVDVYEYKHNVYQQDNYVAFKTSAFFTSEAQKPYVAAVADEIVLYVEKTSGYYYSSQSIQVLENSPSLLYPYAMGSNMMHPSGHITPGEYANPDVGGMWYITAKNAVTYALGAIPGAGTIAGFMIDVTEAYSPDGTDTEEAAYSSTDTSAWSKWVDDQRGSFPVVGETVEQECFQVFNWRQKDDVNPVYYMKIKVYAGLTINVPTWEYSEFSTFNYYTSPIYLYIKHEATNPGGGGCPILSVWDGEGYADEGLLDIHNPEGDDVTYTQYLSSFPEAIDGKYTMRLTEYFQTRSHIDQVKFYGRLPNGHWVRLRLLSAEHSALGDVRSFLRRSDDFRVDLLGADFNGGESEYIDLWFRAPNHDRFTEFRFVIEGNNIDVKF